MIPWWRKKNMEDRESDEDFVARIESYNEKIKEVGHRFCGLCGKECVDQKHRDRHMKKVHGVDESKGQSTLPV